MRVIETQQGLFFLRPYQPGDEWAILSSWKEAFGKEMSLEEWRWKYPENPEGFRCLLCLAEDGTVVAHYAAQVMRVAFRGGTILGLHLTDSFSHPRFRWAVGGKRGLFVQTGWVFLRTFLEKIELPVEPLPTGLPVARLAYGFPGERHFRLGWRLMKYRLHGPGVLYLRARHRPGWRYGLGLQQSRLQDFELWEEIDRLFEDQRPRRPFCVERRARFLRWRFRRPGKEYLIFYTKAFWRKRLKAWMIGTPGQEGLRLLDFWARDEAEMKKLLQAVLAETGDGAEVWLAGNHPWRKAFFEAGFQPENEPLGIVPCSRCYFADPRVPPETADGFFFTMADADLF